MKRSEEIAELVKALVAAQAEMKVAPKLSKNPHFGSRFAGLPEVMEVARVLAKHGIAVLQPASSPDDGTMVDVETTLAHTSGQWMSETLRLRPMKPDPQGIGSAITYGRRYGLCSFVGIVADEDDDGNAASQRPPTKGGGNGDTKDTRAMEASIEARLAKELEQGFADWKAKRDWRDLHKTEKDALPREAQLRLSQAWVKAKPAGAAEVAPS